MNRHFKFGIIVFSFFFLFSHWDLWAENSPDQGNYRERFRKERDRAVPDRGDEAKGGKSSRKKNKKKDVAVLAWVRGTGSIVTTHNAENGQLLSLSDNGFSAPGAVVIWDPGPYGLKLSSSRQVGLLEDAREIFAAEGAQTFLDRNGLSLMGADVDIQQLTGLGGDRFMPVSNHPEGIFGFDPFSSGGGPLKSRNTLTVMAELSEPIEIVGNKLMLLGLSRMNPATSAFSYIPIQYFPDVETFAHEYARTLINDHSILWGLLNPRRATGRITEGWEGEVYLNTEGEGALGAAFNVGGHALALVGGVGTIAYFSRSGFQAARTAQSSYSQAAAAFGRTADELADMERLVGELWDDVLSDLTSGRYGIKPLDVIAEFAEGGNRYVAYVDMQGRKIFKVFYDAQGRYSAQTEHTFSEMLDVVESLGKGFFDVDSWLANAKNVYYVPEASLSSHVPLLARTADTASDVVSLLDVDHMIPRILNMRMRIPPQELNHYLENLGKVLLPIFNFMK